MPAVPVPVGGPPARPAPLRARGGAQRWRRRVALAGAARRRRGASSVRSRPRPSRRPSSRRVPACRRRERFRATGGSPEDAKGGDANDTAGTDPGDREIGADAPSAPSSQTVCPVPAVPEPVDGGVPIRSVGHRPPNIRSCHRHGSPVSRSQAARAATGLSMRTFLGQLRTAPPGRFVGGGAGGGAGFRSSPPAMSDRDQSTR